MKGEYTMDPVDVITVAFLVGAVIYFACKWFI
jgi:hypothetical protein